jgi:CDP-glucose 4,6-dehydratase
MEDMAVTQAKPSPDFWRGKRVLLTGHTGFKGSWLALWLHRLGADVVGVSMPPEASPNLFELAGIESLCQSHFCDIRDSEALAALVRQSAPDVVLHLAAQSLVRTSYREPLRTFATNIQGTANLLDALRGSESVKVAVVVTTDKVYQNLERQRPFTEVDPLGGHDPYSASKAASEIIISSYRDAYLAGRGVALASARAGNVIGGGDWSDDRLVPDAIRAWNQGMALEVRRPQGVRPWQHVLEPLSGYLRLAEALWQQPALAGAYNFGPETREAAPVREVIELARSVYGRGEVNWGDGSDGPHEAGWLSLEIAKSKQQLGVSQRWNLAQTVGRTMDWYRLQAQGGEAVALCAADIAAYEATPGTAAA